ncbi:related to COX15-cytochrome oxidase assembly factor [Sporisorium reilianum SRZ2]|uniref:Related to COX15-cytochrome oxidase assembly factor n=1 Tax=Sporisorium reilianum (strain SRZ2) TaxID=999809 RepID=E6ZWH0_SPORE|nr:related to COX15-cytochrome oxidase assembly factor [Sporisorium reilianum SRZ2]
MAATARMVPSRLLLPATSSFGSMLLPRAFVAARALPSRSVMTLAAARPGAVGLGATMGAMRSLSTMRPVFSKRSPILSQLLATRSRFQPHQQRFQSTATISPSTTLDATTSTISTTATPLISKPVVALHLYALAFLVYAIVVVGGLTRLTESGLSITEWNPGFKGMRLPTTTAEWEAEWDKYKLTPEFQLLNSKMSLDDFKAIYMWEWGHRVLGRVIGVAFVLPAAWFVTRRWVGVGTRWKLGAIAAGIGFQGFLGWFMVKSGLSVPEASGGRAKVASVAVAGEEAAVADWTPRVSHFRLAMHMGTAFLVYLAMLHTGLAVQRDYNAASLSGSLSGVRARTHAALSQLATTLRHPLLRSHSRFTKLVAALVFTTAMSGALVAGLDAGLVYNEFPTMGDGRLAPPMAELMDDRFAQRADGSDKVWRNLAQNPVTVQLIHRTLAVTTAATVLVLAWRTHRLSRAYAAAAKARSTQMLPALPPRVLQLAKASVVVVAAQVTLGISTLVYMVPIPLASAHQAGSLALLSVLVGLVSSLRPVPARILRAVGEARSSGVLKRVLKGSTPVRRVEASV